MTKKVTSLEDLLAAIELNDVVFVRVSGERFGDERTPEEIPDPEINLRPGFSDDGLMMIVHAIVQVGTPAADFRGELQLQFKVNEPIEVNDDAMGDFISSTALVVATPYLRETVVTLAAKLRVPVPTLPLVRPGMALTAVEVTSEDES